MNNEFLADKIELLAPDELAMFYRILMANISVSRHSSPDTQVKKVMIVALRDPELVRRCLEEAIRRIRPLHKLSGGDTVELVVESSWNDSEEVKDMRKVDSEFH